MSEHELGDALQEGAWLPEIYAALCETIEEHGNQGDHYNSRRPPIAVIGCDEALLHNDLAETIMRHVINRRLMKQDRGFWQLIPERSGREAISAAFRAVAGRSDGEISQTAAFRRYRAGMFNAYEAIRANEGVKNAYLFAARMLRGLHERNVTELTDEVLDIEFDRPLSQEDIPSGQPFPSLSVPTGLRFNLEILDLLRVLELNGFDTWICAASEVHIVRSLVRRINFPEDHVIGLELQQQNGNLGDRVVDSVPTGEGRLELFLDAAGRSPVLVVGGASVDRELMDNCEGLSVIIGEPDEATTNEANERNWKIQPVLSI